MLDISFEYTENMQKYIDGILATGDEAQMANVARIYREQVNYYVPCLTGTMRESAIISAQRNYAYIDWNPSNGGASAYVVYQNNGWVKGPNKAVFDAQGPNKGGPGAGVHRGWVSPKQPNQYTGRRIGEKATITLKDGRVIHINGYTTPGTGANWIETFLHNGVGSHDLPGTNILAGRYIYEAYCAAIGEIPNGGFRVYNMWNHYG